MPTAATIDIDGIELEKSWRAVLLEEFQKQYMADLCSFLKNEYASGKQIYPPKPEIFAAFKKTPFDKVNVVVVGQDPYHRPGQANGLCFSVPNGVKPPRSLQNIFKEVSSEFGSETRKRGDLSTWAEQGVLLLNSVLTVEDGKRGSHRSKGWEPFTDKIVEILGAKKENLVFMLWGRPAQEKAARIDPEKHLVLESRHPSPLAQINSGKLSGLEPAHPSPLACQRPFLGNNHFRQADDYLRRINQEPINWLL